MTLTREARTIVWNDRPIVRVEGMVMVRGELGFTPHKGYDNSRVAIYESENRTHYLIYGYKIKDNSMITLNDLIPTRMSFTKASPIFHHWRIGDQRMGLTFSCTADGRSFDRGIRVALENLEKGMRSSSPSDESTTATPTSTDSFNLPAVDDVIVPDSQAIGSPQGPALASPNAVASAPTFRPHAMSASSRRQTTPPSCSQRCHSSSKAERSRREQAPSEPRNPNLVVSTSAVPHPLDTTTQPRDPSSEDFLKPSTSKTELVRPPPISTRRHKSRQRTDSASTQPHKCRRTKTPILDNLERQRDMQPTKPNSYVQIASSKSNSTNPGAGFPFTRLNSRTNEAVHLTYSTTRFLSQRSAFNEYRYRGLNLSDDMHGDFSTMPLHPVSYVGNIKKASKRSESKRNNDKMKEDLGERSRCRNCQAMFNLDRNPPGSCPESPPDDFERCIECASCICVPRCVVYSCCRDSNNYYDHEPCSCPRRHRKSSRKQWFVFALASIFFPCLCMYPILKSCHRCGVACHCCGGKHEPMPHSPQDSSSSIKLG